MSLNRGRRVVTTEEARLWRDAMKGVRAFPQSVAAVGDPLPAPPTTASPLPPAPLPYAKPAPNPCPPPTPLPLGRGVGVDKRTFQRFKSGDMPIDSVIDLHGMTQAQAHAALIGLIDRSAVAGLRCLLVITGKGGLSGKGVLRAEVPRWLNEPGPRSNILAVTGARPQHGGEGAYYVLLRRRR